ncbi:MAG: septal ring lytic transglycosylase RlpA family protein [Solirubrobacteraceae bacterium]
MAALLLASGLAVPSAGWAASGGATPSGGAASGGPSPSPSPSVGARGPSTSASAQPGDTMVSASGNGITVATKASARLGDRVGFSGTVPRAATGRRVEIERRASAGGAWTPTAHATAGTGTFTATWHADHTGAFAIRAVIEGQAHPAASPALATTIYRASIATTYGPGFYGQRTACGQRLVPHMLGVANRTLKCGTPVAIYYRGRTIVVPVIDRGPYANHADWDLTEATGTVLGIDGTATIGAVGLPTPK